MLWRFEGRVAVAVHSEADPSRLEWTSYLRDTLAQPTPTTLRVLIVTYGGIPSGQQRKELTDSLRVSVPTAYLSNRWLARSLVNTLAWFNPHIRAFGLDGSTAAYDFLGLTQEERTIASRHRMELERQLSVGARPVAEHTYSR